MAEIVDLKALERKAYLSYHQDGLVDIFIGLAIVLTGILFLPPLSEYAFLYFGSFTIIFVISYAGVKRAITVPRIGYVEFTKRRQGRVMFLVVFLLVFNVILFLIPALGLLTPELSALLIENGLLVIAVIALGIFTLFGFVTQLHRLIGYGLIAFIVFVVAYFFRWYLSIPILVLGIAMTVYGFVLLFRFLQKYPKEEAHEEVNDDWGNA